MKTKHTTLPRLCLLIVSLFAIGLTSCSLKKQVTVSNHDHDAIIWSSHHSPAIDLHLTPPPTP